MIEDDLEEEQSNLEMMVDKARKNGQQVRQFRRACHYSHCNMFSCSCTFMNI